jgi:AraC-like DNA-binding protein
MEYLLGWRRALAKDQLQRKAVSVAEVAERVGYSSASSFSAAFTRHVGLADSLRAEARWIGARVEFQKLPRLPRPLCFSEREPGAGVRAA